MSDAVLRPLGLSDTAVRLAPDQAPRLAQGHGMRQRPVDAWYLDGLAGAGALRSTAPDLLRYLRAQAKPDSTPLAGAIRLTHQLREPARRHTFGLGWMRTELPTGELWWHNGGTGGFRSFAGFSTDQRRVAAVLVNDGRGPDAAGFDLIAGRRGDASNPATRLQPFGCFERAMMQPLGCNQLNREGGHEHCADDHRTRHHDQRVGGDRMGNRQRTGLVGELRLAWSTIASRTWGRGRT